MAEPIPFKEGTMVWKGPGDIGDLPAYCDAIEGKNISCWQLDEDELKEIKKTGVVWLYVWSTKHPPVLISAAHPWS